MRAAAASLLLAMVVAWPRLAPPEPALPAPEAAPLAGEPPADPPPPPRAREPARRREAPARVKGGRRVRAAKRRSRVRSRIERPRKARTRHRRVPHGEEPTTPVRANGTEPAVGGGTNGAVAPPPDPAQAEFGFESG